MAIRLFLLISCLLLGAQDRVELLQKIEELYQNRSMDKLIPSASALLNSPDLPLKDKSKLQLYLGEAFSALNQPEEAIKHLLEVDRTDPNSPYRLNAYLKLKELVKTDTARYQNYLEKIFSSFPKTPEAIEAGKELATILITSKTYSQALEVLGTLYKLWNVEDPNGILQMQLATAYAGLRDYVEAADYIQSVEQLHADFLLKNPDFILTSAQVHYSTQRFDRVTELLTRLINVYPSSPRVLDAALLLAQSYDRLKNPFLGSVTLIQAMKNRSAGITRYDLMLLLGQLISQLQASDREQLAQLYPGMADSDQLLRQVYNEAQELDLKRQACQILARILRERNLPEQAVDICLDYLSKNRESSAFKLLRDGIDDWLAKIDNTQNSKSLLLLWNTFQNKKSFLSGNNLLNMGRQLVAHEFFPAAEEVMKHIRRYRLYEQYWPEAQEQQIKILLKTQRFEETQKELVKAGEQIKTEARYRWYSLQLAIKTKAGDEAIDKLLTDLPPLDPKESSSWNLHIAAIDRMIEKKEYQSAKNLLKSASDHADDFPDKKRELLRRFALLAFHQGEFEHALALYTDLAQIPEEEPWALFRQITILKLLGRIKEGQDRTEQLKSRFPDSYWSRQIR